MQEKKVTPSEAKRLLDRNVNNRPINATIVKHYADMMKRGKWHVDADTPIKIAVDNTLLDGQHRLMAVVESNTTQAMTFRTNCDKHSQQYMDRGRKRSLSDDLHIQGYKYNSVLSSSLSLIWRYLEEGKVNHRTQSIDLDTATFLLTTFPELSDWVAYVSTRVQQCRKQNGDSSMVQSEAMFMYFLIKHTEYADLADEFLDAMLFGVGDEQNPCNAFKREIVREKRQGKSRTLNRQYLFGLAFTAWNKYVKNESVKYLRPPKEAPALMGFENPLSR
jgi:hypothetical protein